MQHRAASPYGLLFLYTVLLFGLGLFATPVAAQDGPPSGTPATSSNPDNPADPPNLFVIAARGCTVSEGASVTLADYDGTRAKFVDGRGVDITATASQISITLTGGQFFGDVATYPDPTDDDFDTGNTAGGLTVVTTTGIACQGTGARTPSNEPARNAAEGQYRREDAVIVETIPKKALPATGGPPFFSFAVVGLALAGVGLSMIRVIANR